MGNQIDKTKILLDSFEVLKDDWSNNRTDILKIFFLIFKENVSTALEMWDFLLNQYKNETKSDSYLVSGILVSYITYVTFDSQQIKILLKHVTIINTIFSKSSFIKADYRIYIAFLKKLLINKLKKEFIYFLDIILTNKVQQVQASEGYFNNEIEDSNNESEVYNLSNNPEATLSAVILFELLSRLEEYSLDNSIFHEILNIIYSYIEREPNQIYRAKLNVEFLKLMSSI